MGAHQANVSPDVQPEDDTVVDLIRQRRDIQLQRLGLVEAAASVGHTSPTEVIHCRNQLLAAELELAESADQRLAMLQERLRNATILEERAIARARMGLGTQEEMLAKTAARLTAQIDLVRAETGDE